MLISLNHHSEKVKAHLSIKYSIYPIQDVLIANKSALSRV
jgi:hypothetical protein